MTGPFTNPAGFAPGGVPQVTQSMPAYPGGYFGTPWIPQPQMNPAMPTQTPATQPSNPTQQMPSQQPMPQMQGVRGKIIKSVDEITPQDVPMDGSSAIFPLFDGSAIILKGWDANGSIKTVRYVPEKIETPSEPSMSIEDLAKMMDDRLTGLERIISKPVYEIKATEATDEKSSTKSKGGSK